MVLLSFISFFFVQFPVLFAMSGLLKSRKLLENVWKKFFLLNWQWTTPQTLNLNEPDNILLQIIKSTMAAVWIFFLDILSLDEWIHCWIASSICLWRNTNFHRQVSVRRPNFPAVPSIFQWVWDTEDPWFSPGWISSIVNGRTNRFCYFDLENYKFLNIQGHFEILTPNESRINFIYIRAIHKTWYWIWSVI